MKQVIVVRKDLTMRKGKMAAQVAHASVKSILTSEDGEYNDPDYDEKVQEWLADGMAKIVVCCDNEDELFQITGKAKEYGLMTNLIKDAGLTEFKEPTYTCVAIGPDEDYKVDQVTGHLKLL